MIYDSVLEKIGQTPIFKLNNIMDEFQQFKLGIYLKDETYNPGGSHKSRIAFNMIRDAERKGILKPNTGQTILEPTGGNTGTGIAMVGSRRGYRVILVIPDNYSPRKQETLKKFGAKIILSDSGKGGNSHGELAMNIQLENPDYVMLNQGQNPANPNIHRLTTAREILEDFKDEPIDYFVGGIGTGGHITGVGEILKQAKPEVKIIGVQPLGCDLLNNKFIYHKIQGLAVGIIPQVLNVNVIDRMISVTFEESDQMMNVLTKREGLSLGISSGANLAAVFKIIKELDRHQEFNRKVNILTMGYDSVNDYI